MKDSVICSPSGGLIECLVGNPMSSGARVTTEIRLDASNLHATHDPLNITVNVTTLVDTDNLVHLCFSIRLLCIVVLKLKADFLYKSGVGDYVPNILFL